MRYTYTTAIGLIAALAAAPALAGALDAPQEEPEITPAPSMTERPADHWTGGWVGASVGAGSANYNVVGDLDFNGAGSFELPDLGGEGFLGSIEAGYSMQVSDQFVLGFQIDYTGSNIDNEASFSVSNGDGGSLDGDYRLRAQHMVTGALRAGYLPSETTQIYGLAGITHGRFDAEYSVSGNGDSLLSGGYDYDLNGFTLGVGMETMIADNVSMKLEYRYTRFEDENLLDFEGASVDVESSLHTARLGVNYRF